MASTRENAFVKPGISNKGITYYSRRSALNFRTLRFFLLLQNLVASHIISSRSALYDSTLLFSESIVTWEGWGRVFGERRARRATRKDTNDVLSLPLMSFATRPTFLGSHLIVVEVLVMGDIVVEEEDGSLVVQKHKMFLYTRMSHGTCSVTVAYHQVITD